MTRHDGTGAKGHSYRGYLTLRRVGGRSLRLSRRLVWRLLGIRARSDEALVSLLRMSAPMVFDVGANTGASVDRYLRLFPAATVHSFEPFPEAFGILSAATAKFENVSVHELALADQSGERLLYVNESYSETNSLLPRATETRRYYPSGANLEPRLAVRVETVHGFCSHNSIDRINLLKLDVQGTELLVLQGATELLQRQTIDVIFTEMMIAPHYEGGVLYYDLARFLDSFDYTLFNMYDHLVAGNGQLRQCDAIFVSREIRERIVDTAPPED